LPLDAELADQHDGGGTDAPIGSTAAVETTSHAPGAQTLPDWIPSNWQGYESGKSPKDEFEGFIRDEKAVWVCYRVVETGKYYKVNTALVKDDFSNLKDPLCRQYRTKSYNKTVRLPGIVDPRVKGDAPPPSGSSSTEAMDVQTAPSGSNQADSSSSGSSGLTSQQVHSPTTALRDPATRTQVLSGFVAAPYEMLKLVALALPLPARLTLVIEVCHALRGLSSEPSLWEALEVFEFSPADDELARWHNSPPEVEVLHVVLPGALRLLDWIEARGASVRSFSTDNMLRRGTSFVPTLLARMPHLTSLDTPHEDYSWEARRSPRINPDRANLATAPFIANLKHLRCSTVGADVLRAATSLGTLECVEISSAAQSDVKTLKASAAWMPESRIMLDGRIYHRESYGPPLQTRLLHFPRLECLHLHRQPLNISTLLAFPFPTLSRLRVLKIDHLIHTNRGRAKTHFLRDALVKLLTTCPVIEELSITATGLLSPVAGLSGTGGAFSLAPRTLTSLELKGIELEPDAFDATPSLRSVRLIACGTHSRSIAETLRHRGVHVKL